MCQLIPGDELGKVYSLLAGLEAFVPVVASPVFSVIYNNTLDTFIGAVFLVEAGLIALSGIVFVIIFILLRNSYNQVNIPFLLARLCISYLACRDLGKWFIQSDPRD